MAGEAHVSAATDTSSNDERDRRDTSAGSFACRLCGSRRSRRLARLEGYAVLRCRDCAFVFSDLDASEIPGLYDQSYFREEFGPYFASSFGDASSQLLAERFREYADCLAEFVRPGHALDVGCAGGLFLDVLEERGWRPVGSELSPYAADIARKRGHEVHTGDFMSMELPDQAFDAISLLDVIEHLPDPKAALRRLRPLLRREGALLLVLPSYRNLTTLVAMAAYRLSLGWISYPAGHVHQIYHVSYFTPTTISRLLREEGFEPIAIRSDETIQGLIGEPAVVRLGVRAIFSLSRALGLQNKMIVVARRAPSDATTP